MPGKDIRVGCGGEGLALLQRWREGKQKPVAGLLQRERGRLGSLTSSRAEGAGGEHVTDAKEKAELPFCIHKTCDKPFDAINISWQVESGAEPSQGTTENG